MVAELFGVSFELYETIFSLGLNLTFFGVFLDALSLKLLDGIPLSLLSWRIFNWTGLQERWQFEDPMFNHFSKFRLVLVQGYFFSHQNWSRCWNLEFVVFEPWLIRISVHQFLKLLDASLLVSLRVEDFWVLLIYSTGVFSTPDLIWSRLKMFVMLVIIAFVKMEKFGVYNFILRSNFGNSNWSSDMRANFTSR